MSLNTPKYLHESLHGDDFFRIHTQIATTLVDIIKSEDITNNSLTLGLLGEWGSGKSKIVRILKDKLSKERNIFLLEFDVWKYIDSSLYRSILFDLEKELKKKAIEGVISSEFINGYISGNGETLYNILYSDSEIKIPQEIIPENIIHKYILFWESLNVHGILFSKLFLRPANAVLKIFLHLIKRFDVLVLITIAFAILISGYSYRINIYSWFPFTNTSTFKFIAKLFFASVVGLGALEFLKEFFKDFFKELLPKEIKNVIISSPPTFAQDQFELIFKDIIAKLNHEGRNKIVLVFDNIDRCELDVTLKVLTGLKTFLDEPNCFYLIPCDDLRIKEHFRSTSKAEDDYLDKIFQAYIRIPKLTEENKIEYIKDCIKKSDFKLVHSEQLKIVQILTLAYKGNTPRQIKRFFNDFISYYKLALTIDPENNFLLKDIGHFTFMITIKQKWPQVEELLIKFPGAFKNYVEGQNQLVFPTDFSVLLEQCSGWIDIESNPADFIFLKNAKQDGSNVQKIILEGSNDFILNNALIIEFKKLLEYFILSQQFIFLEAGLERLKEITNKALKEDSDELGIELFKLYIENLIKHENLNFDNKRKSFILSHFIFLSENVKFIKQFDINKINKTENDLLIRLKIIGYNDETKILFIGFVEHFNISNITKIFREAFDSEIENLLPFILTIKENFAAKMIPVSFFDRISNLITLGKDEDNLLSIFRYLAAEPEIRKAKKIITSKIYEQFLLDSPETDNNHIFILKAMDVLDIYDWNDDMKSAFDDLLIRRINKLFKNGQHEIAIEYSIYAMLYNIENLNNLFEINNEFFNLNSDNFFILVNNISSKKLNIIIKNEDVLNGLLSLCSNYNFFPQLYDKIEISYIIENIPKFCYEDLNCLTCLLDLTDLKQKDNKDKIGTEKNILEIYNINHRNLLIDFFDIVIPKVTYPENKINYILSTINHLSQDFNGNVTTILHILDYLNFDTDKKQNIYDIIYNNNKINILSLDNVDLFNKMIFNISLRNQAEYLNRILLKIKADLLIGLASSNTLKTISETEQFNLPKVKNKLYDDVISELIESSRNSEDNLIGLKLINKVYKNNDKVKERFKLKINSLMENPEKSEEIRSFIKL